MLFYDFTVGLHFFHVDILRVSPQHEQRDEAYPYASMEASKLVAS